MTTPESKVFIRFIDLVANPHIQTLVDGLEMLLPEATWWVLDETLKPHPFPYLRPREATGPAPVLSVPLERKDQRSFSQVQEVEGGELQGVAVFRFQQKLLGGIALCHAVGEKRSVLQRILRILESYFSLLTGILEDHDDLEIINNLWNETICVVNLNELLDRLTKELCLTLKVNEGLILLIDEDGEFYPAWLRGFPPELQKKRNLTLTKYDYIDWIKDFTSAFYLMKEDDPLQQWLAQRLKELGWKLPDAQGKAVAIPFLRGSNLIGIYLTYLKPGMQLSFIKENLLHLFSSGGATALENALSLVHMNQHRKALSTIHTVHRLISSNISTKELLPRIGQLTRQLFKVKKCAIFLYNRQRQQLVPRVKLGLEKNEVGHHAVKLGEELPGWVAENFNATIYHPSGEPPPWKSTGEAYPSESYLAAPLYDNDIEGVITIADKNEDFTPGDREILMTFAEQVVLAIKNVRLHEGERTITINALKSIANLIETLDPQKPGITVRACDLAAEIAGYLYLNQRDYHNLIFASLLHDTGMLRSLYSTVPLDEHRLKGPQLSLHVVHSLNLSDEVGEIVYHVNEAWSGQGYPDGLKGSQIPLGSRIIAVANAFTTLYLRYVKRGEDEGTSTRRGLRVLERLSGRVFDPDLVHALKQLMLNPRTEEDDTTAE